MKTKTIIYWSLGLVAVGSIMYYFRKNLFGKSTNENSSDMQNLNFVGYNSSIDMLYADGGSLVKEEFENQFRTNLAHIIVNKKKEVIDLMKKTNVNIGMDASDNDILNAFFDSTRNGNNKLLEGIAKMMREL